MKEGQKALKERLSKLAIRCGKSYNACFYANDLHPHAALVRDTKPYGGKYK